MEITIDGFTVQSTENGVYVYNESGARKGHFPTKTPIHTAEELREIYNVWNNVCRTSSTYLAAKGITK